MLIGLCGPPCAGKREVASFLVSELGFTMLENASPLSDAVLPEESKSDMVSNKNCSPSPQLTSQCWRHNINVVISNVPPHDPNIPQLLKRPYFLLIYIDAPLVLRFNRSVMADRTADDQLAAFLEADDKLRHDIASAMLSSKAAGNNSSKLNVLPLSSSTANNRDRFTLSVLERISRLRILNAYSSLPELFKVLRTINFTDTERLRPSWDSYFMSLAKLAAERTNCMKRRVGCVIARNKRMVATGYNGTPSGVTNCSEGGCGRCNGAQNGQGVGLDLCLCLHAEENAIIEAGRERCQGGTLYTNLFPCILCSKKIVQSGILRVVFDSHYATDTAAEDLLRAGNVIVDAFRRDDISNTLKDLILNGVSD